ncbi:hypothetical protein KIH39_01680 [Telmatocola sphagniphila]|uniref:HEAT repeat domain-containing protein n=1 Tax=Telmatocola sphagniphila TaxID=1123043 RepID=A0A8E6B698_9BACT|nr:hypothetical protein [Telmatocola sphagniphila]QVL32653.1 hypothetical protein KIH39_01680 [Telmatocola sphagniphila]
MSSVPLKNILKLVDPKQTTEIRRSAIVVLGELGQREGDTSEAIHECLRDTDQGIRLASIVAIGQLKIDAALPELLEKIKHGGLESELAADAVAKLGVKGRKALQDLMGKVAPGLRKYIASSLAASGADRADADALKILQDKDPAVVEAALGSMMGSIPNLGASQRKALADQLIELVSNKKQPIATSMEAAALKLLAVFDDPRIGKILWERVQPGRNPDIRMAALQSIGKFTTSPNKEQLAILFGCACEPDFRMAAPALMMLKNVKVTDKSLNDWLVLFKAVDSATRQFAMDKLEGFDTPELAGALLPLIRSSDRKFAEAATRKLTELESGRKLLSEALLEAETPDQYWQYARMLVPIAKQYPARWRDTVFKKLTKYIEENDRRADSLVFLMGETDAGDLRERLETFAVELRKKKAYERAYPFLRTLARDPACGMSARFELATVGLKLSAKDFSEDSRAKDTCLHSFSTLLQHQQNDEEIFQQLEKVKWLEPEDLYYLGFHFADHEARHKKFASLVLKLVVKRSPKSKLGQNAKAKLKTSGLQ